MTDGIYVREPESTFVPAPQGLHQAVCVDVVDMGLQDTPFGEKHKVKITWLLDAQMETGDPYMVSQWYTASLHERAKLRQDLESWRGRSFTTEELQGFDLEKLLSANAQLLIVHNIKGDRTYANVKAITPLLRGTGKLEIPATYIRFKNRPRTPENGPQPRRDPREARVNWPETDHDDDDLPF